MLHRFSRAALVAAVAMVMSQAQGQQRPAGNAEGEKFPLAAPAGVDTGAITKPPADAVNQGMLDPTKWKYGPAFDAPANSKIWNPVMIKMMKGEKVTGGTVFSSTDPATYCAMANAGYDFIWTEMQHDSRDWEAVGRMWRACPHAKAVPGVRVAYTDEREIQHAMDLGALVIVVPTIRSVEEGTAARNWTMYPPLGKRSASPMQASDPEMWGSVPGGYRNTINDNVVLIEMIETLDGARDAREIAGIKGVTGIFAASGDLGNFSGYRQGSPDYERLINIVHGLRRLAQANGCAGHSRGVIGPISRASRPAAR